jgi:HprK-related kinase A
VKIAALSPGELDRRLRATGLRLRTGPFVHCIRSPLQAVRDGIALHYGEHSVDEEFADFHISVERPQSIRRWIDRQVVFRVDGQSPFTPLPGDQGFPMLEWGMNWCVSGLAHQFLTLHAAVVEREGRAMILPAPSGSGKSTLCAALIFNGWRLLSDELAVLDPRSCEVVPLPRPISLKNASIDALRDFAPDARFGPLVRETTKGTIGHMVPPAEAVRRSSERAQPGWLILPQYTPGADARLETLAKGQAMMRLVECAFNYNIFRVEGFELLADVVERSECFTFKYSRLEDAVDLLRGLVGSESADAHTSRGSVPP